MNFSCHNLLFSLDFQSAKKKTRRNFYRALQKIRHTAHINNFFAMYRTREREYEMNDFNACTWAKPDLRRKSLLDMSNNSIKFDILTIRDHYFCLSFISDTERERHIHIFVCSSPLMYIYHSRAQ